MSQGHDADESRVHYSSLEVLRSCLGLSRGPAQTQELASLAPEAWLTVLAVAQQHKVMPLLFGRIERLGVHLPEEIARSLHQSYRDNALRNLRLKAQLASLVAALQAKGIPVIVLKGMHLAEEVYGGLALRTMEDIDLLANEDDLPVIDRVLLDHAYRPRDRSRLLEANNHHFCYSPSPTGAAVEIHWALIPRYHGFRIDYAGLWSRSVALRLPGARGLSLEDLVLHLCLHAAKDLYGATDLKLLCDLDEVFRRRGKQLDWQALTARAREWGIERSVYLFLRLTRELLDAAVPEDVLEALRPAVFEERYLTLAREQVLSARNCGTLVGSPSVASLMEASGTHGKLRLICDTVLIPRETLARIYGTPSTSWRIYACYAKRARDLLMRYRAPLWRLARRDPETQAAGEHANRVTALKNWVLNVG